MTGLRTILRQRSPLLVALSGGVDSSCLLAVAAETLGCDQVTAATVFSESVTGEEVVRAHRVAHHLGVRFFLLTEHLLDDQDYVVNDERRCYHCRRHMYRALRGLAIEQSIPFVVDGVHADDPPEERPGFAARDEAGVVSPLQLAGWTKARIREEATRRQLPTADIPANACLASRLPHGTPVTLKRLDQVAQAEEALHKSGLRQVRVRFHGDLARVELGARDLAALPAGELPDEAVAAVRDAGFRRITIAPYRGVEEPP